MATAHLAPVVLNSLYITGIPFARELPKKATLRWCGRKGSVMHRPGQMALIANIPVDEYTEQDGTVRVRYLCATCQMAQLMV